MDVERLLAVQHHHQVDLDGRAQPRHCRERRNYGVRRKRLKTPLVYEVQLRRPNAERVEDDIAVGVLEGHLRQLETDRVRAERLGLDLRHALAPICVAAIRRFCTSSKAFENSSAPVISLIFAKLSRTSSIVGFAKTAPLLSTIAARPIYPPPAVKILPDTGHSSEQRYATTGDTSSGFSRSSATAGMTSSVNLEAATGAITFALMLYFAPSSSSVLAKPTRAVFADE